MPKGYKWRTPEYLAYLDEKAKLKQLNAEWHDCIKRNKQRQEMAKNAVNAQIKKVEAAKRKWKEKHND